MMWEKIKELKELDVDKLKNANVLITGANGLIASSLVECLVKINKLYYLNMNIYCLCRNECKAKKRFESFLTLSYFHLIISDVAIPLDETIEFMYIFHLASSANPTAFNETPVGVMMANFIGTKNVLDYAKNHKNCRVIFVSSSEVYGENFEEKEIFNEDDEGIVSHTRFRACYPESKRASETLCFCYEKQYDVDFVITRPAFIYGKNILDDNNRADVYFLRQALNKKNIIMYSEGKQIRQYCYVFDCVTALLFAALNGVKGNIYNIGNEKCVITLKEYAEKIAYYGGVNVIIDVSTAPQNLILLKTSKLILNSNKLKKIGWKPLYSLDDGIKDIFKNIDK